MFFRLFRAGRLFRSAGRELVTLWYASRHPATPRILKFAALLLALYVISPLDLIPDWFPFAGWLDDVSLLVFLVPALLKLMPQSALQEARASSDRLWIRGKH